MAKETKEERITGETRRREIAERANIAYRVTIPARLMLAQAMAQEVGLRTDITLTAIGPSVRFYDPYDEVFDETVCYTTEEWELEYLEKREKKDEKVAKTRRNGIAYDVWDNKLSDEERLALKENIHLLR